MYESAGTYDEDDDEDESDPVSTNPLDPTDTAGASPASRPPLRSRSTMIRHLEGHLAARRGRQVPTRSHPSIHIAPQPRHLLAPAPSSSSSSLRALSTSVPLDVGLGIGLDSSGSVGVAFPEHFTGSLRMVSSEGRGAGGLWQSLGVKPAGEAEELRDDDSGGRLSGDCPEEEADSEGNSEASDEAEQL